jgi:hypothetical protein
MNTPSKPVNPEVRIVRLRGCFRSKNARFEAEIKRALTHPRAARLNSFADVFADSRNSLLWVDAMVIDTNENSDDAVQQFDRPPET